MISIVKLFQCASRRLLIAGFASVALQAATVGTPHAQDQSNGQGQLSDQDRSQPIEIEADILTLEQDNAVAIFEGHVLAVQGEISLKAQVLKVHYVSDGGDSEQSIRLIEAEGDVVIASPTETATGDEGVYDIVGETMQLTGDVVLTREGNILKGQQLDIDLVANTHRLSSPTDTQQRRIKALFVPASDKEGE